MENRTTAIFAGYNKDVTIDVKSLTVKPDWANLQQTGNLYGIMRVTGGNDVVITTDNGVDLALTLTPDASLENNSITTVGGLLMEASQSAKQPGTLVLDGGGRRYQRPRGGRFQKTRQLPSRLRRQNRRRLDGRSFGKQRELHRGSALERHGFPSRRQRQRF